MLAGRKIDDDGLHRADRFLTAIRSGFTQSRMSQLAQGILRGDAEARLHESLSAFATDPACRVDDRQARRVDRLLHRHAVVDQVERDVEHGVDDGGAAGRSATPPSGEAASTPEDKRQRRASQRVQDERNGMGIIEKQVSPKPAPVWPRASMPG